MVPSQMCLITSEATEWAAVQESLGVVQVSKGSWPVGENVRPQAANSWYCLPHWTAHASLVSYREGRGSSATLPHLVTVWYGSF